MTERMMGDAFRSNRVARWLVLLLVGGAASCGPEPTETYSVGTVEVAVPVGTPVAMHSQTEFVVQVGKSWRFDRYLSSA